MEHHEAAKIFPLDEGNIQELADDIAKNGLLNPIETYQGKILDGRRRSAACAIANVEPDYCEVDPVDPVAYVLSLNLHRRHLTSSQRAMVGARAREMYDRQAKERQQQAGKEHGRGKEKVVENLPQANPDTGKARDAVGKAMNVSGRTIDKASRVQNEGAPEVIEAVEQGKISVSKADEIVRDYPKSEQPQVLKDIVEMPQNSNQFFKADSKTTEETQDETSAKVRGKGVLLANEAINCLIQIPKNDPLRKRGFQIVTDWIKANK